MAEAKHTLRPPMKRGAALCFEGGSLQLNLEGYTDPGSGHFAFTDDELEPIREYGEDGVWDGFLVKLPASELAAIRDFLNQHVPPKAEAALAAAKPDLLDALQAVKAWAARRCPCGPPDYAPDQPAVCPLCDARVERDRCMAVDVSFPRALREQIDRAIRQAEARSDV